MLPKPENWLLLRVLAEVPHRRERRKLLGEPRRPKFFHRLLHPPRMMPMMRPMTNLKIHLQKLEEEEEAWQQRNKNSRTRSQSSSCNYCYDRFGHRCSISH